MIKPITGTWFEFSHHSLYEGKYVNPVLRSFTEEQWRELIRDIRSTGMEYLVLMFTGIVYKDHSESYAPVDVYPAPEGIGCPNALEVLMDEAEKQDMKVFMSAGFYGFWEDSTGNMVSEEVTRRAFRAAEEVFKAFGSRKSFYGWYLPDETEAGPYFKEFFIDYVNRYAAFFHKLDPSKKLIIGPYGTNKIVCDDKFIDQLRRLDCDFVAYQDEVGVHKSTVDQTAAFYSNLAKAHAAAGRSKLWADIELFDFEDQVYRSALVPTNIERLKKQLEAVSPYVERIFTYCYQGLMSKPGSSAALGLPGAEQVYRDYMKLIGKA